MMSKMKTTSMKELKLVKKSFQERHVFRENCVTDALEKNHQIAATGGWKYII